VLLKLEASWCDRTTQRLLSVRPRRRNVHVENSKPAGMQLETTE